MRSVRHRLVSGSACLKGSFVEGFIPSSISDRLNNVTKTLTRWTVAKEVCRIEGKTEDLSRLYV